jgi:beta-barrel assembly-enhancing protease
MGWAAELLDGQSAKPRRARLQPQGGGLRLSLGRRHEALALDGLKARSLAGGWMELALSDGRLLRLREPEAEAWLRGRGALKRPWMQARRTQGALIALVAAWVLGLLAVFGLGWGLDPLLDLALRQVPPSMDKRLGEDLAESLQARAEHSPQLSGALRRLARAIEPEAGSVRILVMDDGLANAFALPGGTLILHRGLLHRLGDQSELYALLGHEAEHLRARHAMRRLARAAALGVLSAAVLGDGSGIAALLAQQGKELSLLRHSRQEELDADAAAIRLLTRLQLDPYGAVRLMQRLHDAHDGPRPPLILSTHPDSVERIARLKALAQAAPPAQKKGLLSREDWQALTRAPSRGRAER